MKSFKIYTEDAKDVMAGYANTAGGIGHFAKEAGKFIWEYIEPTGYWSWDELELAWQQLEKDPDNDYLQVMFLIAIFNALPNFGFFVVVGSLATGPGAAAGVPAGTVMAIPQIISKPAFKIISKSGPRVVMKVGPALKKIITSSPAVRGAAYEIATRAGADAATLAKLGIKAEPEVVKLAPRGTTEAAAKAAAKAADDLIVKGADELKIIKSNPELKGITPTLLQDFIQKIKWELKLSTDVGPGYTIKYILGKSSRKENFTEIEQQLLGVLGSHFNTKSIDDTLEILSKMGQKAFPEDKIPDFIPAATKVVDDVVAKAETPVELTAAVSKARSIASNILNFIKNPKLWVTVFTGLPIAVRASTRAYMDVSQRTVEWVDQAIEQAEKEGLIKPRKEQIQQLKQKYRINQSDADTTPQPEG